MRSRREAPPRPAEAGHLLEPPIPIGDHTRGDPDERRDPVVQAVEHAEVQRREPEAVDDVQRQDGADHLRRHVGHQARQPEEDHVPGHRERAVARPAGPSEPEELREAAGQVHGRVRDRVHEGEALDQRAAPRKDMERTGSRKGLTLRFQRR
jgi:hypothetical protein